MGNINAVGVVIEFKGYVPIVCDVISHWMVEPSMENVAVVSLCGLNKNAL